MTDMLFLYEEPFTIDNTIANRSLYISETARIIDQERDDEDLVRAIILKFALDKELIKTSGDQARQNSGKNTGSWEWAVSWTSFRAMVDPAEFETFLRVVCSDPSTINLILDLHYRIGMRVDHRTLNTIANRTIKSVKLIPYDYRGQETLLTWDYIHKEAPFLWMLIFMQSVIRTEVKV